MTQTVAPSPATDARWAKLIVLCAGMLMIILDQTITTVALPSIQGDLHFSQSSLAWVVNAYLIAFGGLLLLAGRLGDLLGRRTMFLSGLGVFVVSSLVCGFADSEAMLISARFVQGVGGAMTSAVILGMIVALFPKPGEQARAIGVYSFVSAAGASLGLLAGGVLTETLSWHWIFFVNVPIGLVTGFAALRLLDQEPGLGLGHDADAPGAALITGALMLGVYTILQSADHGWGSARTLALSAGTVALLGAFGWREQHARNPLLPLSVLRHRNVMGANAVQVLLIAGIFGQFFLGALYLQKVRHFTAIEVGLAFLPIAIGIGVLSVAVAPRLIMRVGPRIVMAAGLALLAGGIALLTRVPVDSRYVVDFLPAMIGIGVGGGLAFPSVVTVAMSSATPDDAGLVSGIVNTSQQVGGALGLAVLVAVSTSRTDALHASGHSPAQALTGGAHLAFVVATGMLVAAFAVALVVLKPGAEPVAIARPGRLAQSEAEYAEAA
jgi:EmrB/QacA subfamily drug resistance transporter